MGRNKKRNLAPRSKIPQSPKTSTAQGGESQNAILSNDALLQEQSKTESPDYYDSAAYASIIQEYDEAIAPLLLKNPVEALDLIGEMCERHKNCAIVYRIQADVLRQVASQTNNIYDKRRHSRKAVHSARLAATLSPNSIEFAAFHARVLSEVSAHDKDHEEVVRECERGLAIVNPIDPIKEGFIKKDPSKELTTEDRITEVRKLLQVLQDRQVEIKLNNQIKMAIRTYEERKKELEAGLVAWRLVQSQLKSVGSSGGGYIEEEERAVEAKAEQYYGMSKHKITAFVEHFKSLTEKKGKSRSYWNALSEGGKRILLQFRIGDLRGHFKESLTGKALSEAIVFSQKNKTWKFFSCPFCDEKFVDLDLSMKHVEEDHKIVNATNFEYFVPREVDEDWADLLVNGMWRPVDIPRALEIIDKQWKHEEISKFDNISKLDGIYGYNVISKFEGITLLKAWSCDDQKWPLSEDVEREQILDSIHGTFQMLVRNNNLSMKNLSKVIQYTMLELENFIPALELKFHGLDRTPLCICFLGVSQLNIVFIFLQHLSYVSCSNELPPAGISSSDIFNDIKQRIVSIGYKSQVDKHFLLVEHTLNRYQNAAAACTIRDDEVDIIPDSNALMDWLYDYDPSFGEVLAEWTRRVNVMKRTGIECFQKFEEEHRTYQCLQEKHRVIKRQNVALGGIKSIFHKELMKREQGKDVAQSYASLLSRWKEELDRREDKGDFTKVLLHFISSVLEDAQALNVHQTDACISLAVLRKIEQQSTELIRICEDIKRIGTLLRELGLKYKKASTFDYRVIVMPLLKSFMQAQLEPKVYMAEKQKSEATAVVLLKEDKKISSKGDHPVQHAHRSSKAKKKNKNKRKNKDDKKKVTHPEVITKANSGDEDELPVVEENVEQVNCPVVAVSADEGLTNEIKHELEERELEERDLEERLEYQRQIEDEWLLSQITERKIKQVSDTSGAQNNLSLATIPEDKEDLSIPSTDVTDESIHGSDTLYLGPGLRNDIREYNCFLNVIVQTFWHLRKFRAEFMSSSASEHVDIGDPCVVCALQEIFVNLSVASANKQSEAVSLTSLRKALTELKPDSNLFKEPHMYDASEVLSIILDSLHESSTGRKFDGSWDCGSDACIPHKLFGMDILEKMICSNCGIESSETKYTSFFYGIWTSSLITAKNMQPESHFDELFKLVESIYFNCEPQFACHPEVGGCGKPKSRLSYLRTPPRVFAIALNWTTDSESREAIAATLTTLTTEIDMAVFHDGLVLGNKHSLFSMICYLGQHFICFAFNHELKKWIMCDDETVKDVGGWDDIISICERRLLQPQILFFEAVN